MLINLDGIVIQDDLTLFNHHLFNMDLKPVKSRARMIIPAAGETEQPLSRCIFSLQLRILSRRLMAIVGDDKGLLELAIQRLEGHIFSMPWKNSLVWRLSSCSGWVARWQWQKKGSHEPWELFWWHCGLAAKNINLAAVCSVALDALSRGLSPLNI